MGLPLGRRPASKHLLSIVEMNALCCVANNTAAQQQICERLQNLGLVEQKSGRWRLTHQGQIQVMFREAR
jgi:predicted transcriptional regulator